MPRKKTTKRTRKPKPAFPEFLHVALDEIEESAGDAATEGDDELLVCCSTGTERFNHGDTVATYRLVNTRTKRVAHSFERP